MRLLVAMAVLVLAAAACQVDVSVEAKVNTDGSGTLTVGVGLDDKALSRVGNLDTQVRTPDLAAAGWTVAPAAKGPDGLTWLRASKPFSSIDELNRELAEIDGPNGLLHDVTLTTSDQDGSTVHELHGTVDTTRGVDQFSDAAVAAKLNGDPFGGLVTDIEAQEGKPVSDMVHFDVRAAVGDGTATDVHPTLADTKTVPLEAKVVEVDPAPTWPAKLLLLAVIVGVAVGMFLLLRQARHHFRAPEGDEPPARARPAPDQRGAGAPASDRPATGRPDRGGPATGRPDPGRPERDRVGD
jgi:hypothetical protein